MEEQLWKLVGAQCFLAACRLFLVSFAAVANAEDIEPIAVIVKADAPVANAKAKLGWMNAAQTLNIARAGGSETVDGADDA
jgi:hypothetical protein